MTEQLPTNLELSDAYRLYDCRLRIRRLFIANCMAAVGMMAGVGLDYLVYPSQLLPFLVLRLGVVLALALISAPLFSDWLKESPRTIGALGVASALIVSLSFCVMIFATNGALSFYVVALNLIVMAMTVMLPWTIVETAVTCVGAMLFYVVACLLNPEIRTPGAIPIFTFNCSFIGINSAVCVAITYFLARWRFEEFQLRHQLDDQNQKLQDLDRLKTQFFSNVSHELRTPLTLILGPLEGVLARSESLDPKVHEELILVHRNSLRLLKLINDLLDLTRLDQGADTLRKGTIAVGPWVKGIVDSVRHLGLSKKMRMRVEEGPSDLAMHVDPARMEKVLINLLTNAIKYTPVGGTITVGWKEVGGQVAIEVRDTGVGIPEEDLPRVFDRFHQVRSNAANQTQGVGIGLALAKELVEAHKGRIEVESVAGTGSTFRVILPLGSEAPGELAKPVAATPSEESEEPFEKAFRSADRTVRNFTDILVEQLPVVGRGEEVILVADDETDMRQFIVSLLVDDYRVVQTAHGGNVADLVAEHSPALVMLDWMMPERNGLEVCRELRSDAARRDLKVMLLTARIDEQSKIQALAAGADDFLTKPFSSVEVKTRVANLLRAARLQKDLRVRNVELQATVEKLQRTELMLIQSEKMNAIGSLSAGLLHEINNPLNYTMTAISIVDQFRDSLSADMQDLLADIEEGMTRIRDVITHLKNFAYPEKPDQQSTFAIREALRDAMKIAAKDLLEIRIVDELPGDLMVRGQRTQLTHVFINLLGNAAKALATNPAGRPREVHVTAAIAGETATIEVADTGPGIPADVIDRVFEPFFTTRDVGSGMGMGLSICHTIMESHGGTIRVANRPEGGAVFTIEIPLAEMAQIPC